MSDPFPFEIPEHIRKCAVILEEFFTSRGVNEWALMGIQSRNDAQSHVRAEAAEAKLCEAIGIIEGLLSDMHPQWLDTPRFKVASQYLLSAKPPALLKELQESRAQCAAILGALKWTGDGYEWNGHEFSPEHGDYREVPHNAITRGAQVWRETMVVISFSFDWPQRSRPLCKTFPAGQR